MAPGQTCDGGARMQRWTLCLVPRAAEEEYFAQYESLDLLNCLIVPLFFANTISMFRGDLLSCVYLVVLVLKGYQLGLLLLPAARHAHAHKHARYWLILGERLLRQWVATPLLGRGPGFRAWIDAAQAAAAASGSKVALGGKALMLVTVCTVTWWNALLLPLGLPSQVLLNTVCWAINVQSCTLQTAFVWEAALRRVPALLWLQAGLEHVAVTAARLLQPLLLLLLPHSLLVADAQTGGVAVDALSRTLLPPLQYEAPRSAPDVDSMAGRFILAACAAYMTSCVLLLPLYAAWRLEAAGKAQFLAGPGAGGGPWARRQQAKLGTGDGDEGGGRLTVFEAMPPLPTLVRHLGLIAAVSLAAGEALVAACVLQPRLAGVLWPQIIF